MALIELLRAIVEEVRLQFAPDARTAIYEVDVVVEHGRIRLRGATSEPAAAEELQRRISGFQATEAVIYEVVRLPAEDRRDDDHAIVRSATAPLLAGPVISEAHLSQLVLGDRVLILREYRRWYQCRVPDGYIGWIHRGYLTRMTELEARTWELGTDAPLHVSLGARIVDDYGAVLMRLPWGARVGIVDSVAVLPDGLRGRPEGDLVPAERMRLRFPLEGRAIVESALLWTGAPYVWGGITQAGVDCSGLVQAVFRAHGRQLPRDSDLQAREGTEVYASADFRELMPGDLLFFAEKDSRISHVAISMGGSMIVHSSLNNAGVRTNDLLGADPFERELRALLRNVRRVIPPGS